MSIAARYHCVLKDQSGEQVAIFDNFESLHFEKRLNDSGSYTLTFIDNGDNRFSLFVLDGQLEVYRAVLGCELDYYCEFYGLHRKKQNTTSSDGVSSFESHGPGYNDFLQRKIVAYKRGTIRSDKDIASETAMKEYVEENLGPTADDTAVGRLYQGGFTNFTVQKDTGAGIVWTGSRAFENILDIIKDIANYSGIDFAVVTNGDGAFMFVTYVSQMGENRTDEGVTSDGMNAYGNAPVIFDINLGNVQDDNYALDRTAEANVVVVLGDGELSTRDTITVSDEDAVDDSPWNIREVARSSGDYDEDYATYSMTTSGEETLAESQAEETFTVVPLQTPKALYGKHYFLGDRVTIQKGSVKRNKKITAVIIDVTASSGKENIRIEFSDIPTLK